MKTRVKVCAGIALLLGAVMSINAQIVTNVVEEFDFESDAPGTSYGGNAVVATGGSASAQSLELPATSNSSGYVPLTPIDQADDSTTVQFDAQWSSSNNGDIGIGLSEVATISEWNQFGPYVAGTTAGALLHRDGGASVPVPNLPVGFSINDWHTFKMVLSQTTETYDLFIDGVQYATDAAYRDQGTNEDLVTLGMKGNSASTTGFARIDNIVVKAAFDLSENHPPVFSENPITGTNATEGVAYSDTIAGSAIDPNGDQVYYYKVSGPDWLIVATNGDLSGTPDVAGGGGVIGFGVSASDGSLSNQATLNIDVTLEDGATIFEATIDDNLLNAANWSEGLPSGNARTEGVIAIDGSYTGVTQLHPWISGATVVVSNNAVLTLAYDLSVKDATMIVNDATLIIADDIYIEGGTLIFNAGSASSCTDDLRATKFGGKIIINGGTHSSGPDPDHSVGASATCGMELLGGTITAGSFSFAAGSTNSVGGSAVLASAGSSTTFVDAEGAIDLAPDWTGSWTIGSFVAGDWKTIVTNTANGFTLEGTAIDGASFDVGFAVSPDGTTLTRVFTKIPAELSIAPVSGGTEIEISWFGEPLLVYEVQTNSNLIISEGWQPFMINIDGEGETITVTNMIGPDQTFYRVITK